MLYQAAFLVILLVDIYDIKSECQKPKPDLNNIDIRKDVFLKSVTQPEHTWGWLCCKK